MEVDEMDADADANAEVGWGVETELLGAVAATLRGRTDGEEEGDGEGEVAAAELSEAVDATEANSTSSHGGERLKMKSWVFDVVKLVVYWQIGHLVAIHSLF